MNAQETPGLWPEPPRPPRTRPLHYREELVAGQRVYVEHPVINYDLSIWRFHSWMWCSRTRYALLTRDGQTDKLHVYGEGEVRVDA